MRIASFEPPIVAFKRPDELVLADGERTALTRKSRLSDLVRGSNLRAVPTVEPLDCTLPPWGVGCIKPDCGTGGEGFRRYSSFDEWTARLTDCARGELVAQPWLTGPEFRITVACGEVFMARLLRRSGSLTAWADATGVVPRELAITLTHVRDRIETAVVGFDVIHESGGWYLLDANPRPDTSMHRQISGPDCVRTSI